VSAASRSRSRSASTSGASRPAGSRIDETCPAGGGRASRICCPPAPDGEPLQTRRRTPVQQGPPATGVPRLVFNASIWRLRRLRAMPPAGILHRAALPDDGCVALGLTAGGDTWRVALAR